MRKPREMPKRGYYVLMNNLARSATVGMVDVIFTTGVTGKGGHKYWRDDGHFPPQWAGAHYVFYPTLPPGIGPIPGGEPVPAP